MSDITKRVLVAFRHHAKGIEISAALERFSCSVDAVSTGFEILKLIQLRSPYDLLITELLLDEISGFALGMAAKKYSEAATIAVNNGGITLWLIAKEFGIDHVIELPLDLKELCDVSRKLLGMTGKNQFTAE